MATQVLELTLVKSLLQSHRIGQTDELQEEATASQEVYFLQVRQSLS